MPNMASVNRPQRPTFLRTAWLLLASASPRFRLSIRRPTDGSETPLRFTSTGLRFGVPLLCAASTILSEERTTSALLHVGVSARLPVDLHFAPLRPAVASSGFDLPIRRPTDLDQASPPPASASLGFGLPARAIDVPPRRTVSMSLGYADIGLPIRRSGGFRTPLHRPVSTTLRFGLPVRRPAASAMFHPG